MIKTLITEFPLSDFPIERTVTEEKIRKYTYTKEEVKAWKEYAKKPKRARTKKGKYKGDDLTTKDFNEAWVGGKAPKKKGKK